MLDGAEGAPWIRRLLTELHDLRSYAPAIFSVVFVMVGQLSMKGPALAVHEELRDPFISQIQGLSLRKRQVRRLRRSPLMAYNIGSPAP